MTTEEPEKKSTEDDGARRSNAIAVVLAVCIAVVALFAIAGDPVERRYWGTTPRELMDEPLPHDEDQVERDLHLTSTDRVQSRATVRLRSGVSDPYTKAIYTFGPEPNMPSQLRLVAGGKHPERAAKVRDALSRHVRLEDDAFEWGAIHVELDPTSADVWFRVHLSAGVSATALQVDAARQLVLNAAFGVPTRMSDRAIADAIGAGYPTADVAKLDPSTSLAQAEPALRKLFPAVLRASAVAFRVPLDHPLVRAVRLDWKDAPDGHLAHVDLFVARSYRDVRAPFEQCLEKHLGAPKVEAGDPGVKDYVFESGSLDLRLGVATLRLLSRDETITSGLGAVFRALDACRPAPAPAAGAK